MKRILLLLLALSAIANASPPISSSELSHELETRVERVPEFEFVRKEAERLGVRAYLFGGTAAGYAHYVKWDLEREHGDTRFQPDRFDYDYTNIYRSTQDLDIVVDGPPEKARELERVLAHEYPHLQGNKTVWEVRLLREDLGDKQSLLNNPDFLNQHSDSNSTGMIEITKPPAGESAVRDLRDWDAASQGREPIFLRDVRENALHYYFSPLHERTAFYREGRNPPILSVIRYLTKAFQYDLTLRPEDLEQVKKIIDRFDPRGPEMNNSYVRNWLLKKENGRKLIKNAVNIESAWNTLERLGLRKKLIAIENNPQETDSLAWWLSKEPLRSYPVGRGAGKTAKQLGLDIVAHETGSFLAYESITRAHTGEPNVLISRKNVPGEAAAHGDGFYTREGTQGARGTGLTIRFHLDPSAREGTDFERVHDFVLVKNKNALRVIPESIQLSLPEYFKVLAEGKQFSASDRALLEKFKRKVKRSGIVSAEDEAKTVALVQSHLTRTVLNEWFSLPISQDHPEIVNLLLKKGGFDEMVCDFAFSHPNSRNRTIWIGKLTEKGKSDPRLAARLLGGITSHEEARKFESKLVEMVRANQGHAEVLSKWFPLFIADRHPEFVRSFASGELDWPKTRVLVEDVFPHKVLRDFLDTETQKKIIDQAVLNFKLNLVSHREFPPLVSALAQSEVFRDDTDGFVRTLASVLEQERGGNFPVALVEAALPEIRDPQDPRIWKLLMENAKKFKYRPEAIQKAFLSPRIRDLPEAEAWIDLFVRTLLQDQTSNRDRSIDDVYRMVLPLLEDEAWMKKESATRWINELLTVRLTGSNRRSEELLDSELKAVFATKAAKENPMYDEWIRALREPRFLRKIRTPAQTPPAEKATTPSIDCSGMYRMLFDPFGLMKL